MKKVVIVSMFPILVLTASPSFAGQNGKGFYVGAAFGGIATKLNGGGKETGSVFGTYAGYDFNHWFGLETSLTLSGKLENNNVKTYAGALTITPKFSYQINDYFSVYSKIGLASTAIELSNSSKSETYSDLTWTYGIGVDAALTKQLTARLSYDVISGEVENENYFALSDNKIEMDMTQLMLGLQYNF